MKRIVLFFVICTSIGYAQAKFSEGYFIDENQIETKCYIKDLGWKNNPTTFIYKLTLDGEEKTRYIESTKIVGINNQVKFLKATLPIEKSSNIVNRLTRSKEPNFVTQQVFLRVLLEGKANLYYYEEEEIVRFFYSMSDNEIKPLVYKTYIDPDNKIRENSEFRRELSEQISCEANKLSTFISLPYRKKDLMKVFDNYNNSLNTTSEVFEKTNSKTILNFTPKIGFNSSSLSVKGLAASGERISNEFDNEISLRFGFEVEYVLPVNNNKWSLIFDPSFETYKGEKPSVFVANQTSIVDYQTVNIPIGIRRYFFLSNSSKLFLNGLVGVRLQGKSKFNSNFNFFEAGDTLYSGLGFGYNFKSKVSLEVRYNPNTDILSNYSGVKTTFRNIGVIFGYTIN